MHPERNRKPQWKMLNVIALLAAVGLVLEHGLHLTPVGHEITLVAIVIVTYGLMAKWASANAAALEDLNAKTHQEQSRDPAVFGTRECPTYTQARFREALSFYRHEAPHK